MAKRRRESPWQLEPGHLSEVVGTLVGDQVPGLVKGIDDSRLQGPFLRGRQVLFQLLQAGHAQDDCIPLGGLQGETADLSTLLLRKWFLSHMPPHAHLAYPLVGSCIFLYICPEHSLRSKGVFHN